jgi:hypothetical protein
LSGSFLTFNTLRTPPGRLALAPASTGVSAARMTKYMRQ